MQHFLLGRFIERETRVYFWPFFCDDGDDDADGDKDGDDDADGDKGGDDNADGDEDGNHDADCYNDADDDEDEDDDNDGDEDGDDDADGDEDGDNDVLLQNSALPWVDVHIIFRLNGIYTNEEMLSIRVVILTASKILQTKNTRID